MPVVPVAAVAARPQPPPCHAPCCAPTQAFDFEPQSLFLTVWSVAKLGLRPPPDWIEMLLVAAFETGLDGYGPQVGGGCLPAARAHEAPMCSWW